MATRTVRPRSANPCAIRSTTTGCRCTRRQGKNTQAVYTLALSYLDAFLAEKGMPRHLSGIRREHIEAWLADVRDRAGRRPR